MYVYLLYAAVIYSVITMSCVSDILFRRHINDPGDISTLYRDKNFILKDPLGPTQPKEDIRIFCGKGRPDSVPWLWRIVTTLPHADAFDRPGDNLPHQELLGVH